MDINQNLENPYPEIDYLSTLLENKYSTIQTIKCVLVRLDSYFFEIYISKEKYYLEIRVSTFENEISGYEKIELLGLPFYVKLYKQDFV